MAGAQKSGADFAGVILLVILGTFIWKNVPLQSSRPQGASQYTPEVDAENEVPAKLWQDPFRPLVDSEIATLPQGGVMEHDKLPACKMDLFEATAPDAASDYRVVIPMLTEGSEAEIVERRRRRRYAIITGLAEASFVPQSTNTLAVCIVKKPAAGRFAAKSIPVTYEWFQPDEQITATRTSKTILVLYLNESLFAERPMGRFRDLVADIAQKCDPNRPQCRRNASFFLLGPARSGTLARMVRRGAQEKNLKQNIEDLLQDYRVSGLHILSPTATIADSELVTGETGVTMKGLEETFTPKHCQSERGSIQRRNVCVSFLRTIQTDKELAESLVREIQYRQPPGEKPGYVALVSEMDTSFGRSLPRTFANAYCSESGQTGTCKNNILQYSYLRGIDGITPGSRKEGSAKAPGSETKQMNKREMMQGDIRVRRSAGTGQFDYLRRLASTIQVKDRQLRATGKGRIRAIGVLGSDVYDKLLILRALRSEFPRVLFFTTDLDAQLLHPSEFRWARNLVVASSFDLDLRSELQGEIPPFRDSYQTSLFFSTQLATRYMHPYCTGESEAGQHVFVPDCANWDALLEQVPVQLFEVGRNRAVRLKEPSDCSVCPVATSGADAPNSVHRPWPEPTGFMVLLKYVLLAVLVILVLHQIKPLSGRPVIGLSFALLVLLILVSLAVCFRYAGEPLSVAEGVSVWPTQFIRYAAFCLSVYYIVRVFRDLSANCARINRDYFGRKDEKFRLPGPDKTLTAIWQGLWEAFRSGRLLRKRRPLWMYVCLIPIAFIGGGMPLAQKVHISAPFIIPLYWAIVLVVWYVLLMKVLTFRSVNSWVQETYQQPGEKRDAWEYWNSYCELGSPRERWYRTLTLLLIFMAFASLVFSITGFPHSPVRGKAGFVADKVMIIFSVPAMLVLIFLVLDEFRMCIYWMKGLRRYSFDWGEMRIQRKSEDMGTLSAAPDMEWMKIQLIAERTAEIGQLIYYPFLIIIMMLLSRSNYFDNWGMPTGLAIVVSINILLLFISAVKLRREAEICRRDATGNLKLMLLSEPAGKTERIKALLKDVETIRGGAFLPLRDQPLVRASLPLLGAIGLTFGEYIIWFG